MRLQGFPLGVVSDSPIPGGNYAERASPRIFGPATRRLLSAAGLRSGMRVAEIGCGIGPTARWVSTQVNSAGSVVGLDSSSEQLRIAQTSAAKAGTTNLSFREGNIRYGLAAEFF